MARRRRNKSSEQVKKNRLRERLRTLLPTTRPSVKAATFAGRSVLPPLGVEGLLKIFILAVRQKDSLSTQACGPWPRKGFMLTNPINHNAREEGRFAGFL